MIVNLFLIKFVVLKVLIEKNNRVRPYYGFYKQFFLVEAGFAKLLIA